MAANKAGTKSAASKKNNKASSSKGSGSRKTNSTAKSTTSKKQQVEKQVEVRERRRFWSYILFFAGILLLCLSFIRGGGLWTTMYNINRGLFGAAFFLTGPMVIYVALMISSDTAHNTVVAKFVEGFILLLLICGIIQILQVGSVDGSSFWRKLVGLFEDGENLRGGGLASALIGWPLLAIFHKVGASIIIVLVSFTFIMLLTNVTLPQLLKGVTKPIVKGAEAVNEDRIRHATMADKPKNDIKRNSNSRIDVAKYIPPDDILCDNETVADESSATENVEKAEETKDLLALIETATENNVTPVAVSSVSEDTQNKPARHRKSEIVKPQTVNVDKNGQTSLFEKDVQISSYVNPPVDILKYSKNVTSQSDVQQEIADKSTRLVETLDTYGVKTKIVGIHRGPSVTRYELQPAAGVRVSKILGLADDIALNLAATSVRIEAPVPGKAAVGIEVPNIHRDMVSLRELIDSNEYRSSGGKLTFAVGKDIEGKIIIGDLAKMPHMLVAGTTGSGKSVFTNSIILSILYHASPDEVKLILIDPKKVEFPIYNKIPHLLIPVVTEPLKAAGALGWAVNEMNKRYLKFEAANVKNLAEYNDMLNEEKAKPEEERDESLAKLPLVPQIVIVVDEFADLMMVAKSEVEDSVLRLAQLARAAGIHMVIATQSPRADVLTGLIKTNIPSRVSLSVSSNVDSRVILDEGGADKLLNHGDLLYKPVGVKKPMRIQSGYASTSEIKEVVTFLKNEHSADYSEEIIHEVEENVPKQKGLDESGEPITVNPDDDLINQAISIIVQTGNASTAFLQRKLKLGFPRAARIMDDIEEMGIIGPQEGAKPRKVMITEQEWIEMQARR